MEPIAALAGQFKTLTELAKLSSAVIKSNDISFYLNDASTPNNPHQTIETSGR